MFTVAFNIPAIWELETVKNDNFVPMFENLTSGNSNRYLLVKLIAYFDK